AIRVAIEKDEAVKKERQNSSADGTGTSSPVAGGSANTSRGDSKMARFVSFGGKGGFGSTGKTNQKANLTLAERGHISQRVSLNNTRSSITPEESQRLDRIYSEFMGDRNGEMSNGTGSHEL
ncbi:hypothetical protein BGZ97_010035, partial [Linnemannia gamsii]